MKTKLGKQLTAVVVSIACMGSFAASCFAESPQTGGYNPVLTGGGSIAWMLTKVIGVLLLIVALFLFLMRYVSQRNRGYMAGRSLKSVGGLGLGQNKSVQVVEIGRSLYVLGVGNDISLIDKIEDPEEMEFILSRIHAGTGPVDAFPSFRQWLSRLRRTPNQTEEIDDVSASFQAVFQEKMKRLSSRQKKVEDMMEQNRDDEWLNRP